MIVANDYQQLQQRLEYQFHDLTRLTLALSHRSYGSLNNERLEFLGDALLGLVVTDFLYSEFPQVREGDLSRMRSCIVRAESLAEVAKELQLGQDLLLGQGEMKSGGQRRDSILGDTVEALIGAVYLDSGLDEAKNCILRWFKPLLDAVEQVTPTKDPKTALQEFLQQRGHLVPQYKLIEAGGEAHSRLFTVSCEIEFFGRQFTATASSRRKAEQMVAEQFLAAIETGDDG
jgi:ribonuclease-3